MTEPFVFYLWATQLFFSGIMTGLVWFVQINHYPLLLRIPASHFSGYEKEHIRRTTWIVAPAMLLELACCLSLAYFMATPWYVFGNTILLVSVWLMTFLIQVPLHARLQKRGKNDESIRQLS